MRSRIFSQCRDFKAGVMWLKRRVLHTVRARVLWFKLQAAKFTRWEVEVERVEL